VSSATTQGIEVTVRSLYLSDQSSPKTERYAFAYHVRIANHGELPAQLKSRHWIIVDGNGTTQEVRGEGVVGEQPYLAPGEEYEYTSGCILKTPHGEMHGTYQMVREDGLQFDAEIAPFVLAQPHAVN
jgi:ApaG protein